jgi:hypothetical protein
MTYFILYCNQIYEETRNSFKNILLDVYVLINSLLLAIIHAELKTILKKILNN